MSASAAAPIRRPSIALLGAEPWRAAWEYLQHRLGPAAIAAQERGDGHLVIIFPGLATDGSAVAPMRRYCRSLGYDARDWGRGYNTGPTGDVDAWLRDLAAHVASLIGPAQRPATLIGWSLGGLYAREVAKLAPAHVRQVITIGTPFNAKADHSHAGWLMRLLNRSAPAIDATLAARLREAPPVPTTSIYSRTDGIVAWQTCRHRRETDRIEDVEVRGSHIGMGWNPRVLSVVGNRLAQPLGHWQPYGGQQARARGR